MQVFFLAFCLYVSLPGALCITGLDSSVAMYFSFSTYVSSRSPSVILASRCAATRSIHTPLFLQHSGGRRISHPIEPSSSAFAE